ncbi:hypothetical protein VP06_33515, partial [Methylobacterium aquaticum]
PQEAPAGSSPRPGPGRRFLWRSDARGSLVEATEGLAETIGASPVGRSWDDLLAGPVEAEPQVAAALAEALVQRQTFRAVPVRWRIAGTRIAVAVDLSGAPRLGAGRAFAGFSGFGVIHPERVVPATDRPEAPEPKPPRPSLRERAAAVIAVGRQPSGDPAAPPRPVPDAALRPDRSPALPRVEPGT